LISAIFIPLHLYNIVQIILSDLPIQKKTWEILIELGGLLAVTFALLNWIASNVVESIGVVFPYLMGVSLFFQGFDIHQKVVLLQKTEQSVLEIDRLVHRIIQGIHLEERDEKTFEKAFKINGDQLIEFCEQAKNCNQETVKDHLRLRVNRTLFSNKVALVASVVDTVASILLTVSVVVPPAAPPLTIASATLLGCSSLLKIGIFIYDYRTEFIPLQKDVS
jgi:hypothetical protein